MQKQSRIIIAEAHGSGLLAQSMDWIRMRRHPFNYCWDERCGNHRFPNISTPINAKSPSETAHPTKSLLKRRATFAPVSKAKHLLLLVLHSLEELGDVVYRSNPLKHAQDSLIGTTMQRPVQSSNCATNGCVHIYTTTGQMPCSLHLHQCIGPLSIDEHAICLPFCENGGD